MPVKWTPDNDQLLLLKILETHELSVDTKKVAGAWPGDDAKDKPTPRAITERLVRMRQMAKAAGGSAGSFAIKNGPSNPATPTKPRKGAASTPASKASSSKRKKVEVDRDETRGVNWEEDDEMAEAETPSKAPKVKHEDVKGIKLELAELGGVEDIPTKRSRKASRLPSGMVDYSDGEDETEREDSASEYVPEETAQGSMVKPEDVEDSIFA